MQCIASGIKDNILKHNYRPIIVLFCFIFHSFEGAQWG